MTKKLITVTLTLLLLIQYSLTSPVTAAVTNAPQPSPEKLRVEALYDEEPNIEPPIGYNEFDKYYVDLKSDKLKLPVEVPSPSLFLNYYLQEVNKPYKPVKPAILKEGSLPAETAADNQIRLKNLSSGTIYYAYSKAYYTYLSEGTSYTSVESSASNTVKFMTDIAINAYSYGPNQIKIEWDDVWNSGKRMDYKLYISENKTFTNSPPIYIGQDQISQNGPVTVNEASGKLEYIHTVRDPGRVYYIKIVPDTTETELKRSPESPAVSVSSYILAKTTRMSSTEDGTIWKLKWSPVVTGLADSSVKVSYQIYRGTGTGNGIEQYMASIDDTTFFLTVKPGEENNYYIIKATVTRNGQDLYPGIKIQSQKIYVKESEVPSTPSVPQLVQEFSNAGIPIISYRSELRPDSATILWRLPLRGNGEVDTDISYDIWLISDPNMLDEPPVNTMIASSIKMSESNFVMSGTRLIGYKFKVNDLMSNSTYYFKIVAKKDYVEFNDNEVTSVTLQSDAAMAVIITPTSGPIEQPIVPGRPPLDLKRDSNGIDMVTTGSAVITLKNKWYEQNVILRGGRSRWVYRTPEQLEVTSPGAVSAIENGTADPLEFRKVEYDSGVTIDVGCVRYTPDIDLENLDRLATNKVTGFPVTPNDPDEDVTAEGALPDGKKHNVNITVNGLDPNSTYVLWVRAARRNANLISGPSDPLIITTQPDLPESIEKPTVPVFNYSNMSDTYIDLGWNFNPQYVYYLQYGTEDDRSKADDEAVITPEDLKNTNYFRVKDLEPDTVYYFWIQAEATNAGGNKKRSDFSDSYIVKTASEIPPAAPKGFGVKGTPGSVTKDSITYEWITEEGIEYTLEIADNINYKDSKKFDLKEASEFKAANLRSNYRYYARLYAYDPDKKLNSEPTQSITIRTLRSNDDYDSGEDSQDIIAGDIVAKDGWAVNGVWSVKMTGVNADRFVQLVQTDNKLDYCLDLVTMPVGTKRLSVIVSTKIITALDQLGENLNIRTQRATLVIRPGMFGYDTGIYSTMAADSVLEFIITLDGSSAGSDTGNLTFKTPVSELQISVVDGLSQPVNRFDKPLKVIYEYDSANWYKQGVTSGYTLALNETAWEKSPAKGVFDTGIGNGNLSFEMSKPGKIAVGEPGLKFFDDISRSYAARSINNVASVHKLKSVEGRGFEPDRYLTVGDGVKFMFDILDRDYGSNYMILAVKSGIIQNADSTRAGTDCTREKFIGMVIRVSELKTSIKAKADANDTSVYNDINQVSSTLLPKIFYAQEIGVITSRYLDTLGPKDPITRAEAMILTEKLLRFAGEL